MPDFQVTDGFILINKDKDKTSFETINHLKKILKIKKIGHAGTLDKNATGLLIAGIGRSTKLLKYFLKLPKKYRAEFFFGMQTNTDDANGIEINKFEGFIDKNKILSELQNFSGEINQTPPLYSAVHVNGQRAYKMALKNQIPRLKERKIEINKIDNISFNNNILTLDIECSAGTYIRSIARDIGLKTGYFAYLYSLNRTLISVFKIEDSYSLEDIKASKYQIISPFNALINMPSTEIKEEYIKYILNGTMINRTWFKDNIPESDAVFKVHYQKKLLAIVKKNNGIFQYDLVY